MNQEPLYPKGYVTPPIQLYTNYARKRVRSRVIYTLHLVAFFRGKWMSHFFEVEGTHYAKLNFVFS